MVAIRSVIKISILLDDDTLRLEEKIAAFKAVGQPHHRLKLKRLLADHRLTDLCTPYQKSHLRIPGGISILMGVRVDPELEKLLEGF